MPTPTPLSTTLPDCGPDLGQRPTKHVKPSTLAPPAKLKLTVAVEFSPGGEIPEHKVAEIRVALKELGLLGHLETD